MPTAIIALKLTEKIPPLEGDFIGVDRGTLALINQHFPIKLAIGDFDSVDAGELKCIEKMHRRPFISIQSRMILTAKLRQE